MEKTIQKPFTCKHKNEYENYVGIDFINAKGKKVGFYCQALRRGVCMKDSTKCPYGQCACVGFGFGRWLFARFWIQLSKETSACAERFTCFLKKHRLAY